MKKKRNMKKPENFSHVCCVALGKQPMKSELDVRKIPTNKVSTHFCFLPSTSGYVLYCLIFWCVCKCDSTFIYNSNTIWTRYNNNNILCEIIFLSRFRFFFCFCLFVLPLFGVFSLRIDLFWICFNFVTQQLQTYYNYKTENMDVIS